MSTKEDIDISYGISNDFYRLWLDSRMTYTCGVYLSEEDDLEQAQTNKLEHHYQGAKVTPQSRVLDIGCGWGSNIEFLAREKGVRDVVGITLSEEQYQEILARNIPNVTAECVNFLNYEPDAKFDAIISLGMFEHIATPEDVRNDRQIGKYREYFKKAWEWSNPGSYFSLQSVIGARVPRGRKAATELKELAWATYEIFPGAISPRLDAIIEGAAPYWEVMQVNTRRLDYAKTTQTWLDRLVANQEEIVEGWGQKRFDDYKRYLAACAISFENNYQSLGQLSLRRID